MANNFQGLGFSAFINTEIVKSLPCVRIHVLFNKTKTMKNCNPRCANKSDFIPETN